MAQPGDVVAVRTIVERAYGIYIERIGRRPAPMDDDYDERIREGKVFIADEKGVVGLIVLSATRDFVLIENVAVDPAHQGAGIGRALLRFAETYAASRHIEELRLYTNAAMTENLALYPRLGYHEYDRRRENGFDRVFFSRRLPPRPSVVDDGDSVHLD